MQAAPSAREQVRPLHAVKGTIIVLDHECLREDGLYDRYCVRLSEAAKSQLLTVTASEWLELSTLMNHYAALDGLGFSRDAAFSVGMRVGERVHGKFLRTLLCMAGKLGATPWGALSQAPKLWKRSWDGGAIKVDALAEKSALVTVTGTPPCASPFYRASMAGALFAGISPLCRRPAVKEEPCDATGESFQARLSWEG
jgi:hypothetical protein